VNSANLQFGLTLVLALLANSVVASSAIAETDYDRAYRKPLYLVRSDSHGTPGGQVNETVYFLLTSPAENGRFLIADGSGGYFSHTGVTLSGPFNTPRQACRGILAQGQTRAYYENYAVLECPASESARDSEVTPHNRGQGNRGLVSSGTQTWGQWSWSWAQWTVTDVLTPWGSFRDGGSLAFGRNRSALERLGGVGFIGLGLAELFGIGVLLKAGAKGVAKIPRLVKVAVSSGGGRRTLMRRASGGRRAGAVALPSLSSLWNRMKSALSSSADDAAEAVLSESAQQAIKTSKAVDGIRSALKGDSKTAADMLSSVAKSIIKEEGLEMTAEEVTRRLLEIAAAQGVEIVKTDARERVLRTVTSILGDVAIRVVESGRGVVYRVR